MSSGDQKRFRHNLSPYFASIKSLSNRRLSIYCASLGMTNSPAAGRSDYFGLPAKPTNCGRETYGRACRRERMCILIPGDDMESPRKNSPFWRCFLLFFLWACRRVTETGPSRNNPGLSHPNTILGDPADANNAPVNSTTPAYDNGAATNATPPPAPSDQSYSSQPAEPQQYSQNEPPPPPPQEQAG